MASAKATTDRNEIQRWVEARGGYPAHVKSTGDSADPGVLRIDYPGYSGEGSLQRISWDEWFDWFDRDNLAFLYQDSKNSRFSKLVARGSVKSGGGAAKKRSSGGGSLLAKVTGAISGLRGGSKKASKKASSKSKKASSKKSAGASRKSSASKKSASTKKASTRKASTSTASSRKASAKKAPARKTAASRTSSGSAKKASSKRPSSSKKAASTKRAPSSKKSSGRTAAARNGSSSKKATGARKGGSSKKSASSNKSSRTTGSSTTTTNHDEIRRWVEQRGGFPAHVKRTGSRNDPGVLRIDYPGFSGKQTLERMSWDEWFNWFDRDKLAFLYQKKANSRFSKLVRR